MIDKLNKICKIKGEDYFRYSILTCFMIEKAGSVYTINYFVDMYLEIYPNERKKLNQHIKLNGMFLGHIFFDEEICGPLCHMLKNDHSDIEIRKLVCLIEKMLFEGDDYVKSVVLLNIINKVKQERDLMDKALMYFNDKTIEVIRSEWQIL